jgi:formylglycine-generating enzyme required for sulfatase activity
MRTIHPLCLACVAVDFALLTVLATPTEPSAVGAVQTDTLPSVEPATHQAYTETIPDSKIRFDLAAIPGGTFLMGSPKDEKGRGDDEGPQHPVKIRPFWMGTMEVTWDEYDLFRAGDVPCEKVNEDARAQKADAITRPTAPYPDHTHGFGGAGHPVVGISHHAAMEYCRWLSLKTGKAYRLPTEAEWEWACRAGTRTAYFFGADAAKLGDYAWYVKNSEEQTHPVGKKKPNPWGLFDMYGNVAEWCLDHYQKDYYGTFPLDKLSLSPVILPGADRYPHVVRGGSWVSGAGACRSAGRLASTKSWNKTGEWDNPPGIWWLWDADFVGFRVVRAVEEQENLRAIQSKVTRKSK